MKGFAPARQIRCRTCGLTLDAADLGIVRIGGRGRSFKLLWCGQCRRHRRLVLEPKPPDLPAHAGPRCSLEGGRRP